MSLLVCVLGCGKRLSPEFCAAHPDDSECMTMSRDADADTGTDAKDGTTFMDVAHLPAVTDAMLTSTSTITLPTTTINTMTGSVQPALPAGVRVLASVAQDTGQNVMVIQAATITIAGALTVVGDKPLILVATADIVVTSTIDASASAETQGPGGGPPAAGAGAGG